MIRLFFVGFVILGGFTVIALMSPHPSDPRVVAEPSLASEPARAPEPVVAEATPIAKRPRERRTPPAAPIAAIAQVARAAQDLSESILAAGSAPSRDHDPATIGAGGTLTTAIAAADTAVVVEEIVPPAEFGDGGRPPEAFVLETSGESAAHRDADLVPLPDPQMTPSPHDAHRSADLIRRMLAVYRDGRGDR
jgi:hypothetical protein